MSQVAGSQLMALELQTCHLVHPDWLPVSQAEFNSLAQCSPQRDNFRLVLSRYLINTHRLAPLTPNLFTHDWTYCVAGGHKAIQALAQQVTSYLIATLVKSTINGEGARALSGQLGQTVYEQSLQSEQSLRMWTAPKATPSNAVEFLAEKSRLLVDGLWLQHSPGLADWARLMSRKLIRTNAGRLDSSGQDGHEHIPAFTYSPALLDEIDQRLQVDFSIDVARIFDAFAADLLPPGAK